MKLPIENDDVEKTTRWLLSRPPAVQNAAYRWPPGSKISIDGKVAYLISYEENDEGGVDFGFTFTPPLADYEKAVAERFVVCAEHLPESRPGLEKT